MLKKIFFAGMILLAALAFVTCGGGSSDKANETAETGSSPAAAAAEAPARNAPVTQSKPGDFGYIRNQNGDGIVITYKTTNATNITIPDRIENLPVVGIQTQTFRGDKSLRSITLPATITSVPSDAFRDCENLSSVTMPGVTSIGNSAFMGTNLSALTLPAVATIGNSVFLNVTSLNSINLPAIVSVGISAFQGCANLSKVVFGNSLTTIRNFAFSGCINLTEMNVPESLTDFPVLDAWGYRENAANFWNCNKLPLATRDQLIAQGYSGRGF